MRQTALCCVACVQHQVAEALVCARSQYTQIVKHLQSCGHITLGREGGDVVCVL
jgi:hypothetical protein